MRPGLPWVALLAVAVCLSCGGGGGGGGAGGDSLQGTYHLVGVSAETDPTPEMRTTWGTFSAAGAGVLDSTVMHNVNAVLEGPVTETATPYVVGADRSVSIVDPSDPARTRATGRISPDGRILALGSTQEGNEPGLWLAVLREGTFPATLPDGSYHACMFWLRPTSGRDSAATGTVTLTLGAGTVSLIENSEGNTSSEGGPVSATVTPDGTVTFRFGGEAPLTGGVLQGTDLVVLAGVTDAITGAMFMVLIPYSSGASASLVPGEYLLVGLETDPSDDSYRSTTGSIVTDAAGNFTVNLTENDEGSVTSGVTASGTWQMDPNGHVTVSAPGGTLEGGMSSDGSCAVIAGGVNDNEDPGIYFLLR